MPVKVRACRESADALSRHTLVHPTVGCLPSMGIAATIPAHGIVAASRSSRRGVGQ